MPRYKTFLSRVPSGYLLNWSAIQGVCCKNQGIPKDAVVAYFKKLSGLEENWGKRLSWLKIFVIYIIHCRKIASSPIPLNSPFRSKLQKLAVDKALLSNLTPEFLFYYCYVRVVNDTRTLLSSSRKLHQYLVPRFETVICWSLNFVFFLFDTTVSSTAPEPPPPKKGGSRPPTHKNRSNCSARVYPHTDFL